MGHKTNMIGCEGGCCASTSHDLFHQGSDYTEIDSRDGQVEQKAKPAQIWKSAGEPLGGEARERYRDTENCEGNYPVTAFGKGESVHPE